MALESELKKTVVGQDEAIDIISKAIRRNRAGISSVKKTKLIYLCWTYRCR